MSSSVHFSSIQSASVQFSSVQEKASLVQVSEFSECSDHRNIYSVHFSSVQPKSVRFSSVLFCSLSSLQWSTVQRMLTSVQFNYALIHFTTFQRTLLSTNVHLPPTHFSSVQRNFSLSQLNSCQFN